MLDLLELLNDERQTNSWSPHEASGLSTTVAPSSAGSSTIHLQLMPSFLNSLMIFSAMASKFVVANASIVGPAPDRQTPRRPGAVAGVSMDRTVGNAGIKFLRYG